MGVLGAGLRTAFMFLFMFGLFMAIGWIAGTLFFNDWVSGAIFFILIAAAINLISYFFSSRIVLFTYRAKIVSEAEAPRLHQIIRSVAQKAGLPMPKVAIIPSQTPNAFATGRNPRNAVVAATEGLLRLLDDNELEGVIAHELSHIRNRDMLVMTIAATLAGAISFAARWAFYSAMFSGNRNSGNAIVLILVAITAPIAALLIQLAISRGREYGADAAGAMLIGKPLYLASALQKLETANARNPMRMGSPASSSLFIVNPFRGGTFVTLFMTHPPIEKRVERLREMAGKMGQF
ncbi:MAG TPA: zinc metalloprotease HtpX [Methanomassiliicoccales archaeon]|nr:zinc metalloprotease HtpX [Methanomassiliicoccales archaeon]